MKLRSLITLLFLAGAFTAASQESFYNPGVIREIRIRFSEPNWRYLLDSLFNAAGDNGKLTGDVTIDGHLCKNAGIRYKGYSSYNANEIKNPFNIDLDYKIKNQNHLGIVKIKLSNVIHDPSFIREALSYEIARKYLPASQANFVRLFVNDTLIGLYTNVEAVDAKFVKKHWGSDQNSFFKGEPVKLQYPFGQNANLALTHGSDSAGYIPYYNMESETGWNNLFNLINTLDQGAGSAENALNIDRALWMHAFNEVVLNLDSYIGYAQNYYLYRDDNGQFNPILWDLNMSFGSFRDTDGSKHFQGITIPQIKQLDPLALMEFEVSPRPLMTRLFANDTLRKIYFAHMRTILDENFTTGWYVARGAEIQALIDSDVLMDTNKFYTYSDFHANLTTTVGGSGSMIEYPGIQDLMEARIDYLDSLEGFRGQPSITEVSNAPAIPVLGGDVWITGKISSATMAYLGYRFKTGGRFFKMPMLDDGNHNDGIAGDSVYGAMVTVTGHTLQYYIYAQNEDAGALSPERAEHEFYNLQTVMRPGDVVLNEIYTGNGSDGWIELFNTTTEPLQIGGMQLSNDSAGNVKWIIPDSIVDAKGYYICSLSDNQQLSRIDVPLTLPARGGTIILSHAQGEKLETVTFDQQVNGKSFGHYPNGFGNFTYMPQTFAACNRMGTTPSSEFKLYPNPSSGDVYVELTTLSANIDIAIFNGTGQVVRSFTCLTGHEKSYPTVQKLDLSELPGGFYVVRIKNENETAVKKLIINQRSYD